MWLNPVHHTIIATDVAGSGSRPDHLILRMRAELRKMLEDVLAQQNVDMNAHPVGDLGDGYRILLPASISPGSALNPFVANLTTALRLHGEAASTAHRMRLRVVVHSGLLHPEADGSWAGAPLKHVARLLDAQAGRLFLDAFPAADMVLIVSRTMYDDVVRHGYSLDPRLFESVEIKVKETRETAWVHVPGAGSGHPAEPEPDGQRRPAPAAAATSPAQHSAVTMQVGDSAVINAPVVGGNYYSGSTGGRSAC